VGDVQASSVDLVRQLTSVSRGPQYPIYAPLIMSDQRMKAALARQPGVSAAMALWKRITVAVVAVGSLDLTGSQVYAMLSDQGRAELDSLNVAAELCAIQFDAAGRPVRTNYSGRTLAISFPELSAVDEVIAIAGGHQKVEAIRASLISGVVTSLVTDRETAISLLRVAPAESADRA
jgi:DNA-binding transcriptional regulator LsrR (DeoR family)